MRICDYDAIIIGAGVIGAATAYELSKRGMRTLCIDRNQSAGSGSTANSCAIVRFTYSTHAGVALAYEGLHYWLNWGEYLGAADENDLARYVQCGQLTLRDGGAHIEKVIPHLENVNVKFEYWTMDEVIERVPGLDPGIFGPPKRPDDEHFWQEAQGQLSGAIFCPEAGYVSDPQLATRNLQVAAEAHGASFMFRSEVVEITRDRGRVSAVRVRDGRAFTSPVVVNVAGPHSFRINEMAGVLDTMNIKTRALRHEVHHIPGSSEYDFEQRAPIIADDDAGVYMRGAPGNNLLIGSTDPNCDKKEWVDPDDYRTAPTSTQWEAQVLRATRRLPQLGVPLTKKGFADLYDVSDDWLPLYDKTDLLGFYIAIGTSGNQFKNAGVVGHCMAELITAVEDGQDHDSDPLTVTGRYTGLEIDMGEFSRNRSINTNSSMSVHG